jgi:CheY-like chemotaxis protein
MIARTLPKTGPRRRRLLYVEEHGDTVARVEQLLAGRKDLLLVRAGSLDLALKQARIEPPEVMLIDIDLVGIGAPELMKLLRTSPGMQAAPVLALSVNTAPDAIVKGLEAGFFHYLAKPVEAKPFMEALAYALEFSACERTEKTLKESQ